MNVRNEQFWRPTTGLRYVRGVSNIGGERWTEVVVCYVDSYVKRDGPRFRPHVTNGSGRTTSGAPRW